MGVANQVTKAQPFISLVIERPLRPRLPTGFGPRVAQVHEMSICTFAEPVARARQPAPCRRHCRPSRACRRENPRLIRLPGPEHEVHKVRVVHGDPRARSQLATWMVHNFCACAFQSATWWAILLVWTVPPRLCGRQLLIRPLDHTPHPPSTCGMHCAKDGCCGGRRRFQPTTACMQPSLHPVCLLRPWSQLDQSLRAGT